MQQLTASRIAEFTGARLVGDPDALIGPDAIIDSRSVTPGSLFVAIAGERHDGHDFIPDALAAGAAGLVVTREMTAPVPVLVVPDPVAGLSAIAREVVALGRAGGLTSFALTGSSGKTSTKDLLTRILSDAGDTVAPPGSLNNEIGVPLTCCRVTESTSFLISEMGARGIGHIAWLTSIVPPDVALVLNVGAAHLGEFGGVDTTAAAKGELVDAVPETGWAILNHQDPLVSAMASRCVGRVGWFAADTEPDAVSDLAVTALDISLDDLGRPSFLLRARVNGAVFDHDVSLNLIGRHHAINAAAAAAAAIAGGLSPTAVASSLSGASPMSDWRMSLTRRDDGVIVINDAYNANPDSMAAALAALHHVAAAQRTNHPGLRAIAVLGDMLELGDDSERLHRLVGESLRVDELIAVGKYADHLVAGAATVGVKGRVLPRSEVAAGIDLRAGDVVLLKASRSVGLETVARQLLSGGDR